MKFTLISIIHTAVPSFVSASNKIKWHRSFFKEEINVVGKEKESFWFYVYTI